VTLIENLPWLQLLPFLFLFFLRLSEFADLLLSIWRSVMSLIDPQPTSTGPWLDFRFFLDRDYPPCSPMQEVSHLLRLIQCHEKVARSGVSAKVKSPLASTG